MFLRQIDENEPKMSLKMRRKWPKNGYYINFSGDPWKSAALVTLRHADCSSGAMEQYNALLSYNTNNVALRRKIFISAMPRTLIRGPAISIYQGLGETLIGGTPMS